MKTRRLETAVLAAGLALLALIAYERQQALRQPPPSVYSTFDTGPNGYRALYDVLLKSGVGAARFTRELASLDPNVRTLVLSSYVGDPSAKGLDRHDGERLRRFVEGGGRLVVLDTEFAGAHDFTPGVNSAIAAADAAATALARNRYTAGVQRVRAPISSVFPYAKLRGVPLLATNSGMVATAYRLGRGEVVAITAPAIFSNARLRNADNAAFAYNVVAGHGPVAFDEYVHGYNDGETMWQALPAPVHAAFWIVCVIVALALIGANVPFAPPIPLEPADDRDSSAYLDAMATLMRRAHAAPAAIAAFAADARRTSFRSGQRAACDAAFSHIERAAVLPRPSEADVLSAALAHYSLRKDVS